MTPHQELVLATRIQADFCDTEACVRYLKAIQPQLVINAAAYTQVDEAEAKKSLALQLNCKTPVELAKQCKIMNIPFVHYSTDYVFSGEGTKPWIEEDTVCPQNYYGYSKAEGEKKICEVMEYSPDAKFLILRTSWVYAALGVSFFTKILKLGKEQETLRVVSDQIGAPTYATDLATATFAILSQKEWPSGIYHLCGQGETHWYDFAEAIFQQARNSGLCLRVKTLIPVSSDFFPTPAKRPKNSRLSLIKTERTFQVSLPHWKDGLRRCMEEYIL